MTEETKEVDESIDIDYAEVEEHIDNLHNSIDELKVTGRRLGQSLIDDIENVDDEEIERYKHLINRAFRVSERVEKGDKAVLRGK